MSKIFYIDDHLPRDSGGKTIVAFTKRSYPKDVLPDGHPFFVVLSRGKQQVRVVDSNGISGDFKSLDVALAQVQSSGQAKLISFDSKTNEGLMPLLERDPRWTRTYHEGLEYLYMAYWYSPSLSLT